MKHATRCLAVLTLALPLLAQAAQAQFSPDEPGLHQASAVMASSTAATAQAASFDTSANTSASTSASISANSLDLQKYRREAKAEARQQAEWREQRARRRGENHDMSFVNDTCVYSRNTLTYSCK